MLSIYELRTFYVYFTYSCMGMLHPYCKKLGDALKMNKRDTGMESHHGRKFSVIFSTLFLAMKEALSF